MCVELLLRQRNVISRERKRKRRKLIITSQLCHSAHRERLGQPATLTAIRNRSLVSRRTMRFRDRNKVHLQNYWLVDSYITHGQRKVPHWHQLYRYSRSSSCGTICCTDWQKRAKISFNCEVGFKFVAVFNSRRVARAVNRWRVR